MKAAAKVIGFLLLLGAFWALGGFNSERSMGILHNALDIVFIMGAITALWIGGKPIGTLQPVSLRPIFIAVGSLLMIAAFAAAMAMRPEGPPFDSPGQRPGSANGAEPSPVRAQQR